MLDIHALFQKFNRENFQNKLSNVSLEWSNNLPIERVGNFLRRNPSDPGLIQLNAQRLQDGPTNEVIVALLHEMIHAFLFHTGRSDLGDFYEVTFLQEMHRINGECGANVTTGYMLEESYSVSTSKSAQNAPSGYTSHAPDSDNNSGSRKVIPAPSSYTVDINTGGELGQPRENPLKRAPMFILGSDSDQEKVHNSDSSNPAALRNVKPSMTGCHYCGIRVPKDKFWVHLEQCVNRHQ
ncbi:hypothetical protein IWQ62_005847 [Dispira parvispora]|uniref:SprT-like domain-containing protein n=1 Tax=Dispira parvispora TaxID=1520584 RepID=A0A9W8APM6_9FUNG|nr:hypothetical protein IWQ62_005847 [Dispira parvispora]